MRNPVTFVFVVGILYFVAIFFRLGALLHGGSLLWAVTYAMLPLLIIFGIYLGGNAGRHGNGVEF